MYYDVLYSLNELQISFDKSKNSVFMNEAKLSTIRTIEDLHRFLDLFVD